MKKTLSIIVGVTIFLGLLFAFSTPVNNSNLQVKGTQEKKQNILSADQFSYDFKEISMKKGNVSHSYTIKNPTDKPIVLTKLVTSCMCTKATLVIGDKKYGPFGMPGHGGSISDFTATLAPGQEATIAAVFDPAAHGSAGIGKIERSIYLESSSSAVLEVSFTATVKP